MTPTIQNEDRGTATVRERCAQVTGQGTAWTAELVTGMFRLSGKEVPVLKVDSPTALTLLTPWPGGDATGVHYEVKYRADRSPLVLAAQDLFAATAPVIRHS